MINIPLINTEAKYGAVDADDSSCHGYYIIKFSSYPYTLQVDLIVDGQGICMLVLKKEIKEED